MKGEFRRLMKGQEFRKWGKGRSLGGACVQEEGDGKGFLCVGKNRSSGG